MAKAISINKWLVAGAAGAIAWLCIHRKKTGVAGIGSSLAVAGKKRLSSYFNGDFLINMVTVSPEIGKYDIVTIYFYGRMPVVFFVSKKDIEWLSDLCEKLGEKIIFYEN